MSRRGSRISIDRDLEQYLDDLIDEVDACLDDQEDHVENVIADLRLKAEPCYELAAKLFEEFYFEDKKSVSGAIKEAADITVNAAIYLNLKRDRNLDRIPKDLEDDLYDDHEILADITESNGRDRRGGRGRDDRGRDRNRRDSRREAASGASRSGRDDRSDRSRSRNRDHDDDIDAAAKRAEERKLRREGKLPEASNNERGRDRMVASAQENIEANKRYPVTAEFIKENPELFCAKDRNLPIGTVYWLGGQIPMIENGEPIFERGTENVEWEKHRTDLYLAVRATVKPSANIRDDALSRAISARDKFVEDRTKAMVEDGNVVTENKETEFKQILTSSAIAGKFYGLGTPMAKIQTCLKPLGLKFLPNHPVIMKLEQYPLWTMNKELTEAVEDLLTVNDLNHLPGKLIRIMNASTPDQWAYFHDKTTQLINKVLKVELEVQPYLESIITEWNGFANWLENFDNGSNISWFKNNLNHFLRHYFHVYKHGSEMSHDLVDGTDEKYASISNTVNIIYLPCESENFGAACPTKLGRVLESVTPKLYQLLANNIDENADNILVTSSDESVSVYRRATSVSSKVVFMGNVNC